MMRRTPHEKPATWWLIGGLLIMIISGALLMTTMTAYRSNVPRIASPGPSMEVVYRHVKDGDAAFSEHRYQDALSRYERARHYTTVLRSLATEEPRSPSSADTLAYTQVALDVRIKLARVGVSLGVHIADEAPTKPSNKIPPTPLLQPTR